MHIILIKLSYLLVPHPVLLAVSWLKNHQSCNVELQLIVTF